MERLTRENVFNIFRESKRNKFKPPDLEVATAMISAKLAVESDQSLKNAVKKISAGHTLLKFRSKMNITQKTGKIATWRKQFL